MSYLLGQSADERERLRFQDEVWAAETDRLLDALGLGEGSRVLEIGCGIGLCLPRMAQRVGASGEVIALEPNAIYALESRTLVKQQKLKQVRVVDRSVLDEPLPDGPFDAIFARWVFSFLSDVRGLLARVINLLRPGGMIGILDYNHDGFRLFPEAPAFDEVVAAFRRWYARSGGDLWVAGALPGALNASGYHCEAIVPHQKAGAPGSPTYAWIEQFVLDHGPALVRDGLLTAAQWSAFNAEWETCRVDPATVIFSPIVVGVLGRRVDPLAGIPAR